MAKSKVCILTAGKGTRLGGGLSVINKALIPLGGKAVLSHILERFSAETEFVIALGYKGAQVREYLSLAHPQLNVTFAEVSNYDGAGSGPGESLRACRKAIGDSSFYFVSCDTLWTDDISRFSENENWMAVSPVENEDKPMYSLVYEKGEFISDIKDKYSPRSEQGGLAFTGLAHIFDFDEFWSSLDRLQTNQVEKQVMDGFIGLRESRPVRSVRLKWTDIGTLEKYRKAQTQAGEFDFSKTDEFFYSVNSTIIKFFADEIIVKNRVAKAKLMPNVFPKIIGGDRQFYGYKFQEGDTFYRVGDFESFQLLLQWLKSELWRPREIAAADFEQLCRDFYVNKTKQRLQVFTKKYGPESKSINGIEIPPAAVLFGDINEKYWLDGKPFFIHGDLQPDNIIFEINTRRFTLIDWRQDFSGRIDLGDLYYDFAKLLGGIQIDYSAVRHNRFQVDEKNDEICIHFEPLPYAQKAETQLRQVASEFGLDFRKIKLLTGVIYLNMSPLHHHPFDKFLNALGRKILWENRI